MKVQGQHRLSIEADPLTERVKLLDQTRLPHEVVWHELHGLQDSAEAIRVMRVRGAPLIGATAAYGFALALREDASDAGLEKAYQTLLATRPTAVNLRWALDRLKAVVVGLPQEERRAAAWREACQVSAEDIAANAAIGRHGSALLLRSHAVKSDARESLNVMTHCNAGWLATVDWGTALSPIYHAHEAGLPIHVWVSETRPRGQGASLTAWELKEHGVPHTLIADNAAGHLLQRGLVDVVITGADRVSANGDVANKIGTYLKALAAREHGVPFYVALPMSTVDWTLQDGVAGIPIEQRDAREVTHVTGRDEAGAIREVRICPEDTVARNDAFDVTPAHLVSAIITEHGVCTASAVGLQSLLAE